MTPSKTLEGVLAVVANSRLINERLFHESGTTHPRPPPIVTRMQNYGSTIMPLIEDANKLILKNLLKVHRGRWVKPVMIGSLTDAQLADLNAERQKRGFKPMIGQVVFVGKHIYDSRVKEDGYSFDDVIAQIYSSMHETAVFSESPKMSGLVSSIERADAYGNRIIDNGVLECSMRFPRPELYSVIPKGDHKKPPKNNTDRESAARIKLSADSPG